MTPRIHASAHLKDPVTAAHHESTSRASTLVHENNVNVSLKSTPTVRCGAPDPRVPPNHGHAISLSRALSFRSAYPFQQTCEPHPCLACSLRTTHPHPCTSICESLPRTRDVMSPPLSTFPSPSRTKQIKSDLSLTAYHCEFDDAVSVTALLA